MQQHFEQYKAFTDLESLRAFSAKPLRKSARVNTLKFSVEQFVSWAKGKKWDIKPVPWCSEGFFVDRENREEALGKDFLHLMVVSTCRKPQACCLLHFLTPSLGSAC